MTRHPSFNSLENNRAQRFCSATTVLLHWWSLYIRFLRYSTVDIYPCFAAKLYAVGRSWLVPQLRRSIDCQQKQTLSNSIASCPTLNVYKYDFLSWPCFHHDHSDYGLPPDLILTKSNLYNAHIYEWQSRCISKGQAPLVTWKLGERIVWS
jgi:hypothetical protein